jgi:hypothetical protein
MLIVTAGQAVPCAIGAFRVMPAAITRYVLIDRGAVAVVEKHVSA